MSHHSKVGTVTVSLGLKIVGLESLARGFFLDSPHQEQTLESLLERPFRFYISRHRRTFVIGLLSLFLTNFFDAFPPLLIGRAIDQMMGPKMTLVKTLGWLLAVTVGLSIFRYMWRLFWGRFHHSVADDLRNRIMDHFLELGPSYFQKTRVGKAMSLITNDVNLFRMAIGPGLLILLDGFSIILIVPPVMCSISVAWTVKTLCLMPLVPFFVYFIMKRLDRQYERQQDRFSDMSGVAQEIVSGVRIIKSFAQEIHQTGFFNRYSRNYEDACNQVARTDSGFLPVLELFVSVGSVILMFIAAPEVMAGRVSIGQFLAFFQYVQRMVWPMTSLGIGFTHIAQGRASFTRVRNLLETRPEIVDDGDVEISQFEKLDVSFAFQAGERLGIIGPTGAGKSILLDLILRIHRAPENTIFINDIPLEQIRMASLRRIFAVVPQDPFLFQEPLEENLRLGNVEASALHLEQALLVSALGREITSFPQGLQTPLGERGVNLSGGQKQRLTLARAWLKKAPVMVLDDSLSAVDSKTEHHLLRELGSLHQQGLILVSHRLSALRDMDRVLVLTEGRIEAYGPLTAIRDGSATLQRLSQLQEEPRA
jgi:ATP-binding cassette subfamily B protein